MYVRFDVLLFLRMYAYEPNEFIFTLQMRIRIISTILYYAIK